MKLFDSYGDELRAIEDCILGQAQSGEKLRILEAGCGREWYFKLNGTDYELTGLDVDAEALRARREILRDLDNAILGDLRTAELAPASFDIIYNAFVLEHVRGAETVLQNFVRWLKPGGLLIVRFPDRDSVHGLLARLTPHWAHILYYKHAWRMKEAGKPGFPPYPTVYDVEVSLRGFRDYCAKHKLEIEEEFGVGTYRRGFGWIARITPFIARTISLLTFYRYHAQYVDLTFIVRKPAIATAASATAK